jgi:hypothetical protein
MAIDPMSVESRFALTISGSILKRRTPDSILAANKLCLNFMATMNVLKENKIKKLLKDIVVKNFERNINSENCRHNRIEEITESKK